MDATMMPVVKKGSVESFTDAAMAQLGLQKDSVLKDEGLRAQVMEIARGMAYLQIPDRACCQQCITDVSKKVALLESGAVTFVPHRPKAQQ